MSSTLKAKKKGRKSRKSNKLMDRINMFENNNPKPKKKKKTRKNKEPTINECTQTNIENDCNSIFTPTINESESRNLLILESWCKECNLNINIISIDLTKLIIKYSIAKDGTFNIYNLDHHLNAFGALELKSNYQYEFDKVCIPSNITLTTNAWNPITKKGGTLLIESFSDFIIKENAKIDLNGKGFWGGKGHEDGQGLGGGTAGAMLIGSAGGGAYGTTPPTQNINNGIVYGDKYLNILHLGSGGGSGSGYGGSGGGALMIKCKRFEMYGKIQVDGKMGHIRDGSGSGGSISIICEEFKIGGNARITAKGGHWPRLGTPGGYGRIRINCKEDCIENEYGNKYWSEPLPFIGCEVNKV